MANKTIKTRIQNKYDVEKNWDQASFTPLKGELIFYGPDKDDEGNVLHELPRFKVGDGETPIGQLPIVDVSTGGGSGTNDYNDLINKPELGTLAAKDEVAKADLAADVQASLDRVDFATGGTMEGSLTVNGDVTVSGAVHGTSDKAEMLKALEIPFDSNNPWHCIGYFQYDGDGTTEAEETSRQTATIVINPPQGSFSMLFFIDISVLSGSKYDSCVLLVKQVLGYEYTRNSGNILACAIDENSNRVYVYAYATSNMNGNLLVSVVSASPEFHLDVDSTKNCADITEKWTYAKSEYVPVDRAVSDEQGNKIAKTYATKTELSTATTDIENSLGGKVPTSRTVNGKALSANITLSASDVGALPSTTDIPDALSDLTDDSTHRTVTDTEKATWNAKSNFDGNYNSLTNKPTLGSLAAKDQVVKADLSSDLQTAIDRVDFANGGTMGGSLVINGDLTVNGTATTVEIFNENVNVEDNTITLRHNTTTGLSSGAYTGIIAHKYDGTNDGMLVFDNTGTAYVGDEGDLQPLATRSFSDNDDGAIVAWDASAKTLVKAPLEVISNASGSSIKVGNTTLTEAQIKKLISFIDAATYDTASNTWSFN